MKRTISLCLIFIIILTNIFVFASDIFPVDLVVKDVAEYILKTVNSPQIGYIGGEWAILGLSRSGEDIPEEYFQNYYKAVEEYVRDTDGVLHDIKYTEYSRVIIALTSIGKDPRDVAGYNLLMPLGNYDKTIWQGINGPVWALIALDSGKYEIPQNPDANVQATREKYIEHILSCQLADGGWAMSGETSDPDITGMVLQALSKYQDNDSVKIAIDRALLCMEEKQNANGGFSNGKTENFESSVQMIVALCELGISIDDPRFVKNGNTVLDNLLTYYIKGSGFKHTLGETSTDLMSSEQGLYSMAAVKRILDGKNSLYRMNDVISISETDYDTAYGLDGKNPDIKKMDIAFSGKTFADISDHNSRYKIEALSERGIINGKSDNVFEPDSTMTRAEFATIIVKGLGLPIKCNAVFDDVTENEWFFDYVNTAYAYGIVNGISETEFNPNGTITREEAGVMVTRCAKLCGMNTDMEIFEARDILAGFFDYVKISDWAISSLAFCYDEKILPDDALEIKPKDAVTRAEIAEMLFNTLDKSRLL